MTRLRLARIDAAGEVNGRVPTVSNGRLVYAAPAGGGGGTAVVAKQLFNASGTVTLASSGGVVTEWQVPGRITFIAPTVGASLHVSTNLVIRPTVTAGNASYWDFAIINPSTGAVIRKSSAGTHGSTFHGGVVQDTNLSIAGAFVLAAGDFVAGDVTVNITRRTTAGSTIYGSPEYGWVIAALLVG